MPKMIVDVHTHVFPPSMIARRAELAARDPGFAALYRNSSARMADAPALLDSMSAAGVDRSVAAGFWWSDPSLADEHADYLLEQAAASDGRLLPFVPLVASAPGAAERTAELARRGAAGFGEVRPANEPDPDAAIETLARTAPALGLPLLAHCSEEAGHAYPGKEGGLTPGALWRLLTTSDARVIAAHWGGGFPFYALMPEVRALIEAGRVAFDSAASPLLYDRAVFRRVINLAGHECVLWGSDFPLRDQGQDRRAVEAAIPDPAQRAAVLGGNACRWLRLD
jgi:predicted TIM-barrel fold metal-dependent hydrolase